MIIHRRKHKDPPSPKNFSKLKDFFIFKLKFPVLIITYCLCDHGQCRHLKIFSVYNKAGQEDENKTYYRI